MSESEFEGSWEISWIDGLVDMVGAGFLGKGRGEKGKMNMGSR